MPIFWFTLYNYYSSSSAFYCLCRLDSLVPVPTSLHLRLLFVQYTYNSTQTSLTCPQISPFTGCQFISRQLRFRFYGPFYLSHTSVFMCGLTSIESCTIARSICNGTSLLYLSSCLSEPIEQLVWRLAKDWTVRGSNPVWGARFSASAQTGHGTYSTGGWVGRSLM